MLGACPECPDGGNSPAGSTSHFACNISTECVLDSVRDPNATAETCTDGTNICNWSIADNGYTVCTGCLGSSCTSTSCEPGFYLNSGKCATCPAGKICTGGTNPPEDCPAGSSPNAAQTACVITSCPAGQYLDAGACVTCTAGYFCDATGRTACPDSGTSIAGAESVSDCYKICPAWTASNTVPTGCLRIDNYQLSVPWSVALDRYETCTFTPIELPGYDPIPATGNVTNPECELHIYNIEYHPNGGTGGMAVTSFTIEDLPITLGSPTRDNYEFLGWFIDSGFSGSAQSAIPAPPVFEYTDQVFYAKWTCAVNNYRDGTSCLPCPNGGTSAGGEIGVGSCSKSGLDCNDGTGGTGKQTCDWNAATSAYDLNCTACVISACPAGKYLTGGTCEDCTAGYFCDGEERVACPDGGTSSVGSTTAAACYKTCPAWTASNAIPDGCLRIDNYQTTVSYSIGLGAYATCTFTPVELPGYDPIPATGNVTNPECHLHIYNIEFHLNGGTGASTLPFSILDLPFSLPTSPAVSRANSDFLGWFDNAALTGTAIATIPSIGFDYSDKDFYAKWTCSENAYLNAGVCSACPGGGFSVGGDIGLAQCQRSEPCYDGGGVGNWICSHTSGTTYDTNCGPVCEMTGCPGGYYLDSGTCVICEAGNSCKDNDKTPCPANTYCPTGSIDPAPCPGGGFAPAESHDITQCYLNCPAGSLPSNCATITNVNMTVNHTGTMYATCLYNVTADTGFTVIGNGTATPSCQPTGYNIIYNENGGTLGAGTPVSFNVTTLPVTLVDATREYSEFMGWFDNMALTGTRILNIPTGTTGDQEFWARWTCAAGYYAPSPNACVEVDIGYYSPAGNSNRYACPAGFTTTIRIGTDIRACYMDEEASAIDANCDGGRRRTTPGLTTAGPTVCDANNTCTYASQPTIMNPTYSVTPGTSITARIGHYFGGAGLLAGPSICPDVTSGWFSPALTADRTQCPAGYDGSEPPRGANTDCWMNCPAKSGLTNVTSVMPINEREFWNGTTFDTCLYGIMCNPGYAPIGDGTANPACELCPSGYYCDGTGSYQCPEGYRDGGRAKSITECMQICEDYVMDHGVLVATGNVYYDNECEYSLHCESGYKRVNGPGVPAACALCEPGEYCPGGTGGGTACPGGGTSDAGAESVSDCYKIVPCPIANGTGERVCYHTSGTTYSTDCGVCTLTGCDTGWFPNGNVCGGCPAGSYCDEHGIHTCPDGGTTEIGATLITQCFKLCAKPAGNNGTLTITPTADYRNYWNGSSYAECSFAMTCRNGYTLRNNNSPAPMCEISCQGAFHPSPDGERCEANVRTCTIGALSGYQEWIDGEWTVCNVQECPPDQEKVGGACQPCNRENAITYKTTGNCQVATCAKGFHPSGTKCNPDVIPCALANTEIAEMRWTGTTYGPCTPVRCHPGFHIASNACISNERTCTVENGTGTQTWSGGAWGECVATSCNPGWTNDRFETNEHAKQCGACRNKFGVFGEVVATNFITECRIASCLHQGELYNLENNECVPICDPNGRDDETGAMIWNRTTNKCERTCNPGYIMW